MRRASGLVGLAILLAGAFALGVFVTHGHDRGFRTVLDGVRDRPPLLVDEVRAELEGGYYRDVALDVLRQPTVDALIRALDDPYTTHLSAAEYELLRVRTARSYSGVGLTVEPAKEGLIVTSALRGPAQQAGIRPGDVIVSIDGRSARGLPFERSLALIKGEQGSLVRLSVKRRDGVKRFKVVRRELAVPVLHGRLVRARGRKLGYIRLLSFAEGSGEKLEQRARALVARGAKGIVLDLRDNPGGLVSEAVRATSVFLSGGVVCTTEGIHHERRVYEVTGRPAFPRLPLVVLVNGGTASAAEIVAGALAEHRRAVVVGGRTYGKASVQAVRELSDGSALKLTTSVYLTPRNVNLTGDGFAPKMQAVDDPETSRDEGLAAAKKALRKRLAR